MSLAEDLTKYLAVHDAAERVVSVINDGMWASMVAGKLTCIEAERFADLIRVIAGEADAEAFLEIHGEEGDDDAEDEHHAFYEKLRNGCCECGSREHTCASHVEELQTS